MSKSLILTKEQAIKKQKKNEDLNVVGKVMAIFLLIISIIGVIGLGIGQEVNVENIPRGIMLYACMMLLMSMAMCLIYMGKEFKLSCKYKINPSQNKKKLEKLNKICNQGITFYIILILFTLLQIYTMFKFQIYNIQYTIYFTMTFALFMQIILIRADYKTVKLQLYNKGEDDE